MTTGTTKEQTIKGRIFGWLGIFRHYIEDSEGFDQVMYNLRIPMPSFLRPLESVAAYMTFTAPPRSEWRAKS